MSQRVGDTRPVFGVTDDPHGFVKAEAEEISTEKAMASSGGEIKAVDYFGKVYHITGTYTYFNSVDGPHQHVGDGNTITLANSGHAIYIEKSSKNWEEKDYVQIQFDGYYYPNLGS